MRKKNYIETMIQKEILVCMICNCCGKKVETEDGFNNTDITDIEIKFNYGSSNDMQLWQFDICDDCLKKWTNSFKHPICKYGNVED